METVNEICVPVTDNLTAHVFSLSPATHAEISDILNLATIFDSTDEVVGYMESKSADLTELRSLLAAMEIRVR